MPIDANGNYVDPEVTLPLLRHRSYYTNPSFVSNILLIAAGQPGMPVQQANVIREQAYCFAGPRPQWKVSNRRFTLPFHRGNAAGAAVFNGDQKWITAQRLAALPPFTTRKPFPLAPFVDAAQANIDGREIGVSPVAVPRKGEFTDPQWTSTAQAFQDVYLAATRRRN